MRTCSPSLRIASMKNYLLYFSSLIAMTGCVSVETTKAVNILSKEICIVDNPHVRLDFRDAYERRIQAKGYTTKIVKDAAACRTISTYTATYGFHWGTYLATSELKI